MPDLIGDIKNMCRHPNQIEHRILVSNREEELNMISAGHEYLDFLEYLRDSYPDGDEMIAGFDAWLASNDYPPAENHNPVQPLD